MKNKKIRPRVFNSLEVLIKLEKKRQMVSGRVTLRGIKPNSDTKEESLMMILFEIDKLVWDVKELHLGQLQWWGLLSFLL